MEKIIENLSNTLQQLKSNSGSSSSVGGGGGGGGMDDRPTYEEIRDDERLSNGMRMASSSGGGGSKDVATTMKRGWLLGYSRVNTNNMLFHHFWVRSLILGVVMLSVVGVFDWLEQRRVVKVIMGQRGLSTAQSTALRSRSWKQFFVHNGTKTLCLGAASILIMFLWLDIKTCP
jgi:hypothetical protein